MNALFAWALYSLLILQRTTAGPALRRSSAEDEHPILGRFYLRSMWLSPLSRRGLAIPGRPPVWRMVVLGAAGGRWGSLSRSQYPISENQSNPANKATSGTSRGKAAGFHGLILDVSAENLATRLSQNLPEETRLVGLD